MRAMNESGQTSEIVVQFRVRIVPCGTDLSRHLADYEVSHSRISQIGTDALGDATVASCMPNMCGVHTKRLASLILPVVGVHRKEIGRTIDDATRRGGLGRSGFAIPRFVEFIPSPWHVQRGWRFKSDYPAQSQP